VIVLVDSESASAAEIFARVMQLEKRATVVGDHTSGSVMEATDYYYASSGVDYGVEISVANLIMTDGKSLEHLGVNPDEILLPKLADLESGSDPVLSHAAQELGVTLSPDDAGRVSPTSGPKTSAAASAAAVKMRVMTKCRDTEIPNNRNTVGEISVAPFGFCGRGLSVTA